MKVDPTRSADLEVIYTDDPEVVREAATEDYTQHVVPRSWRMSPLPLASAWWALASAMFWLILGALVALTVGTVDAIIGMVLSVIAYGAVNYVLSAYAARTGTTVNLFSRGLFGYAGGVLAPLLVAVISIYFATFEGSVIAVAFHEYFGGVDLKIWYLIVVAYSVPLVFGGVRVFLDKFNGLLFPFYVIGLVVAVVWTVQAHGTGGDWLTWRPDEIQVSGPGWFWAFTVYMGDWVLMMFTWDYARFGRTSRRDIRVNGWLTFGPGFYMFTILVNGLIGIFIALTIPSKGQLTELSGVLGMVQLMGLTAVILVWISQTRINTANFYVATTNLENVAARVFKLKLSRVTWAIIVGAIVYVVMLSDVFSFLLAALRYQSVLTVTWTACVLVWIAWGWFRGPSAEHTEWRPGRVTLFNWGGLSAWAAGTAVGMVMLSVGDDSSWTATWALPLSFVVSALVELLVLALSGPERTVMQRPRDPRKEVDDPWEARIRCHRCGKFYLAVEMDRDPSHGHQAICAGDAQASPTFYRHARSEARGSTGR
ncbi:hypothetical protein [Streptomyces sp. NPDC005336]|uniref:purine-cytosine permease family protein n=1 Tax=unclassified Streptomyces TaxID=2593676 RepID=UPI0033BDFF0D